MIKLKNLISRIRSLWSIPHYVNNKIDFVIWKICNNFIKYPIWVETNSGAKILLGNDKVDEYILEDIYSENKIYEPVIDEFQSDDIFLDFGAHHGIYATEASKKFPGVKIICIEPDPEAIHTIEKHKIKNKLNLITLPYAIGDAEGDFYLVDNNDGSWGKTVEILSKNKSIPIQTKALKNLLSGIDLGKIKLIKSNCEGGEFALIKQMIALKLKPDYLIVMIHPERGDKESLISQLSDFGYSYIIRWDSDVNPCYHFFIDKSCRSAEFRRHQS